MFSSGVGIKTSGESGDGNGQIVRRSVPKRFEITGLVELIYTDYSMKFSDKGFENENNWTSFEQRYSLGVRGYIYDPRLATFTARVKYTTSNTDYQPSGIEAKYKNLCYSIDTVFLPERPLTVYAYALRTNSTIEGFASPQDFTINNFGARLVYRTPRLPTFTFEYSHWDYSTEVNRATRDIEAEGLAMINQRVKIKIETQRFTAGLSGYSRRLKTRYVLIGEFMEFKSNTLKYNRTYVRTTTDTVLKKDNEITTNLQYQQIDSSRLLNFYAYLSLSPIKNKLYQTYGYEYFNSEADNQKSSDHTFSGIWRYRFSRQFSGIAQTRLRFGEKDNVSEQSYDLDIGLNYIKDIKGHILKSKYSFAVGYMDENGTMKNMQHYLDLGLISKPYRWGKLFLGYDFRYRTLDSNFQPRSDGVFDTNLDLLDSVHERSSHSTESIMEHVLRARATGRGPLRAFWTAELEARFLDASDSGSEIGSSVWLGDVPLGNKIRHYTATAEIGYPIGWRATATLRGSYTTGTTDSQGVKRYMYEGRLKYYVLRNMNLSVLLREEFFNSAWRTISFVTAGQNVFDTTIRDYEVILNYRWRKFFISSEFTYTKSTEGPATVEERRFYIKLSRPLDFYRKLS